jgi:protein phosphatase
MDDHIFFAQVGDSRGYILRGETLVQITRDQSLVNQLIEAGQLTEEEAETFEHNNIILQALGTSDTVQVDLTFVELQRGDTLMLCSDGLSGMVRFEEIREVLRSSTEPLEICKALTDRANQAGGHDNITVITVRFDGEGLKAVANGGEPLKYRKYALPEEPGDGAADPARRANTSPMAATVPDPSGQAFVPQGPPDPAQPGGARAISSRPPNSAGEGWHEEGPHSFGGEERIDIPGTHVPAWVVVALVVGVVALLAATAFFLLR